jgi:hypothetical protein
VHSEKDEGLGTLKAGFVRIERRKSYSCEEEAVTALLPHSDFTVVSPRFECANWQARYGCSSRG